MSDEKTKAPGYNLTAGEVRALEPAPLFTGVTQWRDQVQPLILEAVEERYTKANIGWGHDKESLMATGRRLGYFVEPTAHGFEVNWDPWLDATQGTLSDDRDLIATMSSRIASGLIAASSIAEKPDSAGAHAAMQASVDLAVEILRATKETL